MRFSISRYFLFSLICHFFILAIFVLSLETNARLAVFENTNQQDVISAVILGDTTTSKILPQTIASAPIQPEKKLPKTEPIKEKNIEKNIEKNVIALKIEDKKQKREQLAKDLLADIHTLEKKKNKQKKLKQQQMETAFQRSLKAQAEKSLRQQLLNEDIRLQGMQSRQSQGEVNKYKALILQAISEHWIVPAQANKKIYCELMIRIAPGGMVLDVQVTKSSGDPALDSSARAAVLKASPLPVPSDTSAFQAFKQFILKVKPENILSSNG